MVKIAIAGTSERVLNTSLARAAAQTGKNLQTRRWEEPEMKINLALLALGTVLLLAPATSMAKDYCLTFPSVSGFAIVGRSFSVPKKNKCSGFLGFYVDPGHFESATSGLGCVSADGSHLLMTLTTSFPSSGGEVAIDSITLTLPSQAGNDVETSLGSSGDSSGSISIQGAKCATTVPVPTSAGNGGAQQPAPLTAIQAQ